MQRNIEIQNSILQAVRKMTLEQQIKLLEFVNESINNKETPNKKRILQFAGRFDPEDLKEMSEAIKDCEQIDENEW